MNLFVSVFLFIVVFFSACSAPKAIPPKQENNTTVEKKVTKKKVVQHPSLHVVAPKGARIRILNIRPKYHHDIKLKSGNYHIEVSKKGYKTHKSWVKVTKPTTYKVKLEKSLYIKSFTWKSTNERFYTLFDPKTDLIWALPTPYIDYVQIHHPKRFLPKTIAAGSKYTPRIERAKFDTLVPFIDNHIVLYHASKQNSRHENYAKLDSLQLNGLKDSWRLPTAKELDINNPFKKYQRYYQVVWNKGYLVRFNLPVLYSTKTSYSSRAYKKSGKLYMGKKVQDKELIHNSKNISLLLPVQRKDSKLEKIIYDPKLDLDTKFSKLYEEFHSANKAIKALLGDPKLKDISYDKKGQRLYATLFSTTNNFHKKIAIKMSPSRYKQFKSKILDNRVLPNIKLRFNNGKLEYRYTTLVRNRYKEKEAYKEAKKMGNVNEYREYIRLYPNSPEAKKLKPLIKKHLNKYHI
ncbi:MAG: PEGA domain-containing protein [Sulfurimonas sp.]